MIVPLLWGAVAQVGYDARAEIGDVHNRVLSAFEHLSKQICRSETSLRIAERTYATAPDELDILRVRRPTVVECSTRVMRRCSAGSRTASPTDSRRHRHSKR